MNDPEPSYLPLAPSFLFIAIVALLLSREYSAPLAYIGGSLGTLIGGANAISAAAGFSFNPLLQWLRRFYAPCSSRSSIRIQSPMRLISAQNSFTSDKVTSGNGIACT